MVETEYHDPGYDDLSMDAFWDHLKYENAEKLNMTPSEMDNATLSELERKLEEEQGPLEYPDTINGLEVVTPEQHERRRTRVNQHLGLEEKPSRLETVSKYLRSFV